MFKLNTKLVRQEILRRGISAIEFAQQSGLNPMTVRKILAGDDAIQLKTISKLASFLGVDGADLILQGE